MKTTLFPLDIASPFGNLITSSENSQLNSTHVIEEMSHFSSWEDRYRQLIQWGKLLPKMSDDLKDDGRLVGGCESQVWLLSRFEQSNTHSTESREGKWYFHIDSDARVVRGLIALLLAAYNGQSSKAILDFDVQSYFEQVGLIDQLSTSRNKGLQAIIAEIKQQVSFTDS